MAEPILLKNQVASYVYLSYTDSLDTVISRLIAERDAALKRGYSNLSLEREDENDYRILGDRMEFPGEARERERQESLRAEMAARNRRAQYEQLKKEFEA